NNTAGAQGAMVTSEPMGTRTWMPLNDHTRVKPTYDIYDTITKGKVAIGNGRLVSTGDNAPDANFPDGSTSWHWRSPEPAGACLGVAGGEQHRQLRVERARRRQRRPVLRGAGRGDRGLAQGAEQARDGRPGGHHPLPGGHQRAVPVQLQRHPRGAAERELRGG